jgi:ABC-type multidrug transport system fused ATPase/permease subunit
MLKYKPVSIQIILSLYFLYRELGPSVFGGVAILSLLIPFNVFTGRLSRKYLSQQMKRKDSRIRAMYEILNSIKIIKLNAWEETFQDRVGSIREEEIGFLRKNATLKAFMNFVFGSAPILVTLASFGTYVAVDPANNVLTADKVFVCISLFNLLR